MGLSTTFTLKFSGAAVQRGLSRVQSAFKSLGSVAARVGKTLLSPFAALTAMLGAGALVTGMFSFIKSASTAAANMEDLTMQFETLTKSAEITKKLLSEMKDDAAKSPLSISDYAQAGKTLMAFGMEAEGVMPTLKNLADVSMGNAERFESLALAFAQTQAAGRLMGQEVLQFVNAGFNPLQQISKRTGETMVQLKKRMEDGAVSSKEVAQAFSEATAKGGLFYKAIEKGALTTSGKIAKTKDAILNLKIAFGTGFNEGLRDALNRINEFLPKMLGKFQEFGKATGRVMTQLMDAFEEGRLGKVFMAALDVGVSKLGEELLALMTHAGNTFFDALESRATQSTVWKVLTWGGLDVDTPQTKTGKAKSEMTYGELREEYANMFGSQENAEILRQNLQNNVPKAEGNRIYYRNEDGRLMTRMAKSLESIDRRLSDQP
jgi:tape measure domain-containing protein